MRVGALLLLLSPYRSGVPDFQTTLFKRIFYFLLSFSILKFFLVLSLRLAQLFLSLTGISVGGGGRGLQPPSWAEIRFIRANFLKEQ